MSRPNVLVVVVDSLRADAVFGDRVPTPNLSRLAARGLSFRQCVAACTTTTPSFASLLTGCYPPRHGVRGLKGYRLASDVGTLGEVFSAGGYETRAEVTGVLLRHSDIFKGFGAMHHRRGSVPFFSWRDKVLARLSALSEPWLMLLHVWEAHFPYRSPPHFDDRWDKAGYEAAVTATDQGLAPVLEAVPVEKTLVVLTGDHGERFPRTRLGARVSRAGRRVRRELRLATRAPHLNMKLAARGTGHGFGLEEGLIRVPLVFAGPGIPAGVVQDDQVSHVDLLPTLAELCGLGAPTGVDGRTITPLMSGRPLPERPVYMEAVGLALKAARIEGSRLPGWKLLRTDRGMERLLRVDRGRRAERRVRGARYPRMRDELRAFLDAVTSRTKATTGMTSEEEEALEEHLRALGYVE